MVERAVAAVVVATTMHAAVVDGASADAYADYLNSMSEEGTAVVTLFTLPKLWSLRSRELDEKLAVVRVHARHASLAAYERVAGMLPASVMKDL